MSVFTTPARPPEAFQVHRQLKGPKQAHIDVPSRDVSSNQAYNSNPPAPVPSANTGRSNKYTAKSPIVTTMGSTPKK